MLFRPPELFAVEPGTSVDERTDIWVTFFEEIIFIRFYIKYLSYVHF